MTAKKRSTAGNPARPVRTMGLARALQKAGCGTRAVTEEMVVSGQVAVDGAVVRDPRAAVDPEQQITVDGRDLDTIGYRYFAFHKPARVVCAAVDGPDRRRVEEFLPRDVPGLRAAGRLDAKTTGLLMISNDPAWNELAAGGARLEQEYRLQVEGDLTEMEIGVITAGVHLPNLGLFRPLSVRIVEKMNGATVLTMVLREGKVRQVRRMFDTLRHKIILLRRIRVGEIRLGDLAAGALRPLTGQEVQGVRDARALRRTRRRE
jgi:23S rRNA pseudouridine2605 synthase